MTSSGAPWAGTVLFFAAGLVGGFSILHWVWWRAERRHDAVAWTLLWSVDLAALFLVDAWLTVTSGPSDATLRLVRAQLVMGLLLLALPAARAYTRGPRVRPYVLAVAAIAVVRTGLLAGSLLDPPWPALSWPAERGPADASSLLLAVAVVVAYAVVAAGRTHLRGTSLALVVGSVTSVLALVASYLVPSAPVAAALASFWPLPVGLGLEIFGLHWIRVAQRETARQSLMRDATARIANAAWFLQDAEDLLVRARDESRRLLDDPSIEGSLRPLARQRFVAELFSKAGRTMSPSERAFLVDLAQIVSASAERYELADRLRRAAFTDSLTGLPNRHALDEHLQSVLDRADVEQTRVAVLYCDIDGFKLANDRHGHAWGDDLLVRVSERLRSAAHGETVVSRFGGDEFVLVIPRAGTDASLVSLALQLRDGDEPAGESPGRLSVGVAVRQPGAAMGAETLVRRADLAMLEAKSTHVGVALFDGVLRARVSAQTHLRTAMEQGVVLGEFTSHFQPIADARTLEVIEVEALGRWVHGGRTRLPAEWLTVAEQTGLIVPIGQSLLTSSRAGCDRFGLPVAVNIAARQLAEPCFVEQIAAAWGPGAWNQLTIEVTESALFDDPAAATSKLAELRELGVRIALDDFGTGYSSLSRLAALPVDILKIDQAFVREIGNARGRAVLEAILALAEAHGLDVIAEGVESAADLTALVDLGVQHVQGNLLGRPAATLPVRNPHLRGSRTRRRPTADRGTAGPKAGGSLSPAASV